jgi:hypothetical protein
MMIVAQKTNVTYCSTESELAPIVLQLNNCLYDYAVSTDILPKEDSCKLFGPRLSYYLMTEICAKIECQEYSLLPRDSD